MDVTLIEFNSTGISILDPVCPFIFKSACLMVSFEKIFDPSKDRAFSIHDISGYNDSLFVLSICNLHDTWLEPVQIF